MTGIVLVALVLMVLGSTALSSLLDPREHAVRFIIFWLACAWLTVTVLLLALLDLLMVRKDARALQKDLQKQFSSDAENVERDGGDL